MIKETAKRFLDKSLYAIGLCSTIDITPSTSLIFRTTKDGTENRRRSKAMLSHMARVSTSFISFLIKFVLVCYLSVLCVLWFF